MADEKMYAKVRAILAKANSTTFEGEARVFRAKAEELIKKYNLDESRLNQREPERPSWDLGGDWMRDYMRRRQTEILRDLARAPGNRYTTHQKYKAAEMRQNGLTWKEIGRHFGIKATAHFAKTLKEEGYV